MTLAAAATIAAVAAAPTPSVSVEFARASVVPGDRVTVRAQGFRSTCVVYLYLVRTSSRSTIRSARDARLAFVATLRPRRGRASATFGVPPLESGSYVAWCRGCRARSPAPLQVAMPAATTEACPVTTPTSGPPPGLDGVFHGNGVLWTSLPADGVFVARADSRWPESPDDSIGTKLFWFAAHIDGWFALSGRRLDSPSPALQVLAVNRGTMTGFRGSGTWATAVTFPTAGCWKLTARLEDFQLPPLAVNRSFVVKVVRQ